MGKRILAWVILIGFIFLIINIVFIHFEQVKSFGIYALVIITYLFIFNRHKKK